MLKPFVLTLWLLAFTVALFTLAAEVWQGAPILHFVGAVALFPRERCYEVGKVLGHWT
jgi:hypothetical protein